MLGHLYERALVGERVWLRHDDGHVHALPVRSWLGGRGADDVFDHTVVGMCTARLPTWVVVLDDWWHT